MEKQTILIFTLTLEDALSFCGKYLFFLNEFPATFGKLIIFFHISFRLHLFFLTNYFFSIKYLTTCEKTTYVSSKYQIKKDIRKKADLVAGCCQFVLTFKDTQFFKLGNICRHENEEKYSNGPSKICKRLL